MTQSSWLNRPSHSAWLEQHSRDLLSFGVRTPGERGGARWLRDDGAPDLGKPIHTYVTARMTHVYSLGSLMGVPGAGPIAEAAMTGLTTFLRDDDNGGWFTSVDSSGQHAPGKSCYDHAFVLLAASSAVTAGIAGANALFAEAEQVFIDRFWREADGMFVDTWNTEFTSLDDYRGMNSNMHAVEAMLSAASVSGDVRWIERSERVCRFAADSARERQWRIPEHYDADWRPNLELNRDQPRHQFKPFGATVGHGLEWSRLMLHTEAASGTGSGWLLDASSKLFDRAVADGWSTDDAPGFIYTTDWNGRPVVRDRMHWVVAEGINAAAALHVRTGDQRYSDLYRQWWDYAATYLLDTEHGSWRHQLDEVNVPADTVWPGKPDLYHAFQTTLIPRLPLYPMIATALGEGSLS